VKDIEYKIFPIGDSSLTIEFDFLIDFQLNQFVLDLANSIDNQVFSSIIECVSAYNSLSIYYQPNRFLSFNQMKFLIEKWIKEFEWRGVVNENQNIVEIPTIYEGEDIENVANHCQISVSELIKIHSEPTYRVFMMGFLPGFAYLGGMNDKIAIPRKETPRLKVQVGSVGIAGKQTGIYPLDSPGGWKIIGRTNLKLFDKKQTNPILLKAGDLVKFVPL
jgi:inhibitor of KinA